MKKEKKVLISSVYRILCERDPEWEEPKMEKKFKIVFDGWRQSELRAKVHSKSFYTLAWQRGWLPQADWARLRAYAMQ